MSVKNKTLRRQLSRREVLKGAAATAGMMAGSGEGDSFTITNGSGRLYGRTLLPAGATLSTVTNFAVAGTPHPPR